MMSGFRAKMLARALQDPDVRMLLQEIRTLQADVAERTEDYRVLSRSAQKALEALLEQKDETERLRSGKEMAEEMLKACRAVEEWWLREGKNQYIGAPAAIFMVRAVVAKAEGRSI